MRAFRAMAVLGMLVSGWVGWRAAVISGDPAPAPIAPAYATYAPEPPPLENDGFGWRDPPPEPQPAAVYTAPPVAYAASPEPRYIVLNAPPAAPVYRERRAADEEPQDSPPPRRQGGSGWGGDLFEANAAGPLAFLGLGGRREEEPPPPTSPPDMLDRAWREAAEAYAKLQSGDRAGAADAFRLALSLAPDHPNARVWRSERRRLTKNFRAEAFVLTRDISDRALPAQSQVLGSGSTSVFLAWSPRPTARRPVEVFARLVAAEPRKTFDGEGGLQGAAGVSWRPFPDVPFTVSAERLFELKESARDDFSIRAAGGYGGRWAGLLLDSFAEAGVIGDRPDWFFGGQGAAVKPVQLAGRLNAGIGAGVWGSVQSTPGLTLSRIDLGPTLRVRRSNFPLTFSADYRFRVQGNAFPGDGPAVTLSANF